MPLYDYKCTKCGHIFEIQQKITAEPLKFCPECKGGIKRLISAAGIIFKGTGFHVTDYARKQPVTSKQQPVTSTKKTEKKDDSPKQTKTTEPKSSPATASPPPSK